MGTCILCAAPAGIACAACGKGACGSIGHAYAVFMAHLGGTAADNIGTKLFHWCTHCNAPLCLSCCGTAEREDAQCPSCRHSLILVHAANISSSDAFGVLVDYAAPPTGYPDAGTYWLKEVLVQSASLGWISVVPHRPLRPGEALQFSVTTETGSEKFWYTPYPRETVLISGGLLMHEVENTTAARSSTVLLFDAGGIWIGNTGEGTIRVSKEAIVQEPDSLQRFHPARQLNSTVSGRESAIVSRLHELNEKQIWDFMFIHSNKEYAKGEVHIAGSTDLIYYHLVRLYFKKVNYCNFPDYFHHPRFTVAGYSLRSLFTAVTGVTVGDRLLFVLESDSGAVNQQRALLCAGRCFVEYVKKNPA